MFENSPAGLRMLAAEVSVTVTREEQHQGVLAHYPVRPGEQRRIAVELAWCRIAAGKYKGEQAVEVRLDGHRVGELTYLMSQRYGPLVTQALAAGTRPGCEAYLEHDARGTQVTLLLPAEAEVTVVLPAARPQPAKAKNRKGWIVAGAVTVGFFLIVGIVSGNEEDPGAAPPPTTTSKPAPTTTTTTPPPTTTTTTVPAPPPQTEPSPPPQTPEPVLPPPPPVEEPEPVQSGCDPNYTGCVPIDPDDVDCSSGSGNGPAYARGPVQVIGEDIYGLDDNDDGVACENG